jgi:hypothetical protein
VGVVRAGYLLVRVPFARLISEVIGRAFEWGPKVKVKRAHSRLSVSTHLGTIVMSGD